MNFHSKSLQNTANTSVLTLGCSETQMKKQFFDVDVVMRLTKHCKYKCL